ncbi:hypothetical protein IWQ47_005019 [Aquimarina sp. EL_43]|uniref:DUF4132 domain-containing protein n=1 Tax=unclassified Aquimarina TaxID=2627091 RepID=UPI0018C8F5F5|nr:MULTISPECIES: DUF4132 domain-containing protein [unclassified Aquimarina]MBG6132280.1 hypothetical protein [Aquimarina sp. EL_35]MBG6153764.1 hypothetical protein [Aquimarina sp. EL_32]MBG6171920.1 hypothetical protein [Aquimarina sp. EL_43]
MNEDIIELVAQRKKQWVNILHDFRKKMYNDHDRENFENILKFIFGESDGLPQITRSKIDTFDRLATLFSPIQEWNFIDQRLLSFICNDTFFYVKDTNTEGYYKVFFKEWFLPQLKAEKKEEDLFGLTLKVLGLFNIDTWTSLSAYLNATEQVSFLREDKTVNSVGEVILELVKEDEIRIIQLLENENYIKPLLSLLGTTEQSLLDTLLEKLPLYYTGKEAQKHIRFSWLEELCKIDLKKFESFVVEKMEGSDCICSVMQCHRILFTRARKKYRKPTAAHIKKVLPYISERKNLSQNNCTSNWPSITGLFQNDIPKFIGWVCKHFRKETKTELFSFAKDTKQLNLEVVQHIVDCYKQDAIEIAIEALKTNIKDNTTIAHYRQAFALLEGLDFSKYYDLIWDIACSEYQDLADIAASLLSRYPTNDIFHKAKELTLSEKKEEKRAGVFVLSKIRCEEAIASLQPIVEKEILEDVRNIAVCTFYNHKNQSKISIEDIKKRIHLALQRGKLDNPIPKWAGTLPELQWQDGTTLSKTETNYLFYRQISSKKIDVDIEAEPMYALLDQKKGADFAYDLFQNMVKNTGMKVAAKPGFAILGKLGDHRLAVPLQNIAIHDKNINACIILGIIGTRRAALALDQIIQHFYVKHPNVRYAAEEAFESIAEQLGLTYFELKDSMIPDFNFINQKKVLSNGYVICIGPQLKYSFKNQRGKQVKSIIKTSEDIKTTLKNLNVIRKHTIQHFKHSLENYLVIQKFWKTKDWKKLFLNHPIAFACGQTLIWQQNNEDTFIVTASGKLKNYKQEPVNVNHDDQIRLAHPIFLKSKIKTKWKKYLENQKITPVIQQLDRNIIQLPRKLYRVTLSTNFKGRTLTAGKFKARAQKRGWRRGSIGDGGSILSYKKAFKEGRIEVFVETYNLQIQGMFDKEMILGKCFFTPLGFVQTDSFCFSEPRNEADHRLITLQDVPKIIYSEAMNDLEKIMNDGS